MGIYKRLPRTKPKPVAGFATWLDHTYHWLEHNWRAVLGGIAAVAVVTGFTLLISSFIGKKDEAARNLYYQAVKAASNSDEAIALFNKLLDTYPKTKIAKVAMLKLSDIWYNKADYAKMEDILVPLQSASSPEIRILALHNIALAKLSAGNPKAAAEIYLKAYNDGENSAKGLSYFYAGLAYEEAGAKENAKKIFEEIAASSEDYFTPELKEKSNNQLIWMTAH